MKFDISVMARTMTSKTVAVPYAFGMDMPSLAKTYKCKGNGLPVSKIDMGISKDEPTTYITAAASENALVTARIIPVKIPGTAMGSRTDTMHCHLLAPIA